MRTSYIKISVFVIHSVRNTVITPVSVYGKRMQFAIHKTPNPNRANGSTGGGVTQMMSAENPKLKQIHTITVYYNMN